VTSHVHKSPHPYPTPVELEAIPLACIILTWMAQKLPSRFLIFCLEAKIFKFKVLFLRLLIAPIILKLEKSFLLLSILGQNVQLSFMMFLNSIFVLDYVHLRPHNYLSKSKRLLPKKTFSSKQTV